MRFSGNDNYSNRFFSEHQLLIKFQNVFALYFGESQVDIPLLTACFRTFVRRGT